ncbi:MAG: metallophosphoesterase [Deltaproteobacteria bacterium]|nr:metallophosphoesterase [Deltaproteobacteria bacterium]
MWRTALLATAFVSVLLTVWVAGHTYLADRLIWDLDLGEDWTRRLTLVMIACAALPLLAPVFERLSRPHVARWVAWPANLWMGLAFLLLVGFAATDLLLFVLDVTGVSPAGPATARLRSVAVLSVALAGIAIGMRSALSPPQVTRCEIEIARWPAPLDGLRIVQISDIHIGAMQGRRFARAVVERVNGLRPDVVAVTGDLVDGTVPHLAEEVEPFAELRARHGVFFVTGNHDYYSGADPWLAYVSDLGMRPLRNERIAIEADGGVFDLAGVDDHRGRMFGPGHGEDVPRALAGRDVSRPVILLAHDPATFPAAARHDVDLQLSGHTHGGQIWPFGWLVRAAVGFVAGHYRRGRSQLLVSCGTGYWGPPIRLRAPAEILEVILRGEGREAALG